MSNNPSSKAVREVSARPNIERLMQLANHLLYGKLGHENFYFGAFNNATIGCGTNGCSIGECPFVWPEAWEFRNTSERWFAAPLLKWENDIVRSTMIWFGIDRNQFSYLFTPNSIIPRDSTKEQAAKHILNFCDRLEAIEKEQKRQDITSELCALPPQETVDTVKQKEMVTV